MTSHHGRRAATGPAPAPPEAWVFSVGGESFALLEVEAPGCDARPLPRGLTPAEQAVTRLAGAGLDNAGIARRRGCGVPTVVKQLSSAYRKLGLRGRAELVAWLASGSSPP
jgi:DNA-binding CsgD family transcriptional regulator